MKGTLEAGKWQTTTQSTPAINKISTLLSVTVLPAMLSKLTGWTILVYNLLYPILKSILPIAVFLILRSQFDRDLAFIGGAFVAFQFVFITLLGTIARMLIAQVFFFAIVAAIYDDRISNVQTGALVFIFAAGMVVSHYATSIIGAGLLFVIGLRSRTLTPYVGLAIALVSYLWYALVTGTTFEHLVFFVVGLTQHLSELSGVFGASGDGSSPGPQPSLARQITKFSYYGIFALIGLGTIKAIRRQDVDNSYRDAIFVSFLGAAIIFVIGQVYKAYGPERVFFQVLPFFTGALLISIQSIVMWADQLSNINYRQTVRAFTVIIIIRSCVAHC